MNNHNESDLPIFKNLIKSINFESCAVFIGAGLSKPIGYPGLESLLNEMANVAGIERLKDKKISKDWMKDFQSIKESLGEQNYRDCIKRIFNHETKDMEYNPILINLLTIPFCGYVTTNYDPCLEFASRHTTTTSDIHTFVYPNLPVTDLKGRHIFHPHGYVDPNNPESVNSIILSFDEYEDAYEKTKITSTFFRRLFLELDVLFIGFGWSDLKILDNLEYSIKHKEIIESFAIMRNLPLARDRIKFALIDSDTYQKDIEKDDYIGRLGIQAIIYNELGESHYRLNEIIHDIQEATTGKAVAPLPTYPEGYFNFGDIHGR